MSINKNIVSCRTAAEQGDAVAQFNLAYAYANGYGVPKDDAEAARWYRKAAEQGHAQAQCNLGWRYEYGIGIPQHIAEAVRWYRKAAKQGHEDAKKYLARLKVTVEDPVITDRVSSPLKKPAVKSGAPLIHKSLQSAVNVPVGICPSCRASDGSYKMFRMGGKEVHKCVKCGHKDYEDEEPVNVDRVSSPQKRSAVKSGVPLVHKPIRSDKPLRETAECKHLLDACTPLVYRYNAFRITGLAVDASTRDIKRRIDDLKAVEEMGDTEDEHKHAFALNPAPSLEHIREAAKRLQDPERRIIEEFFWFWPAEWGKGSSDPALTAFKNGDKDTAFKIWSHALSDVHAPASAVAKHNLAVMYQLVALDSEHIALDNDLVPEQYATISKYWHTCFKWWEELTEDEMFWSLVMDRIRMLDDQSLTTGFARRMRATVPEAMDKINAMLAISFIEREKYDLAENHITYMIETYQGQDDVSKTMALVTKPLFTRVRSAIAHAEKSAATDEESADTAAFDLLSVTTEPLRILKSFLSESHEEFADVSEAMIQTCLHCQQAFLRASKKYKTKWDVAITILDKAAKIANTDKDKAEIAEARKSAIQDKDMSHPKVKALQDLLQKAIGEELPAKLNMLCKNVANALFELESEVGISARSFVLACDLVAGCLRGLSVELINSGQEVVGRVLKVLADEQARLFLQNALRDNVPSAVEFERCKWNALVEVAVGIDLYDQGRKLAQSAELKKRFEDDAEALSGLRTLCAQVATDLRTKRRDRGLVFSWGRSSAPQPPPPAPKSSSGCFVATAVYGSYDHPAVLSLRAFRDDVLSRSVAGRLLIAWYYRIGPRLASLVSKSSFRRYVSRSILEAFIRMLEKQHVHSLPRKPGG